MQRYLWLKKALAIWHRAAQVVQGAFLDMQPAVGLHASSTEGVLAGKAGTLGACNLLQADAALPDTLRPPASSSHTTNQGSGPDLPARLVLPAPQVKVGRRRIVQNHC